MGNVTLQVNFGPIARAPLPFTCRMLGDASAADLEVAKAPQSKKHEVMFPIGLPDQGYFDWVDSLLEKNPSYTEISDRKILEWATKSGVWRPKAQGGTSSNDKPDMKFGIPLMDDLSVQRVLNAIAPTLNRSYIIPELRSNLLATERKNFLLKFSANEFKKVCTVMMGEPTAEYKSKVRALILADKKSKAEAEKKRKAQEEERR